MSTWTEFPSAPGHAPDVRADETAVRVLLVDQRSGCFGLLLEALERAARGHFEVDCTSCLTHAEQSLSRGYDAVLVDFADAEGEAGIDRFCRLAQRIPVIVLTGTGNGALESDGSTSGDRDLALARIDRAELPAMLLEAVRRHRRLGVCGAEPLVCRIPAA
jgi:DNA-binding response OmpR family regulator